MLIIPAPNSHVEKFYDEEEELEKDLPIINPNAFDGDDILEKVHNMLEELGVRIVKNA